MTTADRIQILGFAIPMIVALICLLLTAVYYKKTFEPVVKKTILLMIGVYGTAFFIWLGIIFYITNFKVFTWYNTFFFFVMMMNQVMLFYFIYILTETGRLKFSLVHYVIPIILAGVLGLWSCFVPFDVQYSIVESRGINVPGYIGYSVLFSAPLPVFFFYNSGYSIYGLFRIRRYRKEIINYSADDERSSLRWLYALLILILLTLPAPLLSIFVNEGTLAHSPITLLAGFSAVLQYVIICYNLITGNYVIIQPPTEEESSKENKQVPLERKRFETYIKDKKPYLDPKLKITDLTRPLQTNRSYLSGFINREYGMNFNCYFNWLRLEELDELRTKPECSQENGMELVTRAGFNSYRDYLRVRKAEEMGKRIPKD